MSIVIYYVFSFLVLTKLQSKIKIAQVKNEYKRSKFLKTIHFCAIPMQFRNYIRSDAIQELHSHAMQFMGFAKVFCHEENKKLFKIFGATSNKKTRKLKLVESI